jgi:hypothetical protein
MSSKRNSIDRKQMVKTFIGLNCNVGFKDSKTKTEVLSNDKGQTAFYWYSF